MHRVPLPAQRLGELRTHLMLVYTGMRRVAHEILEEQLDRTRQGVLVEDLRLVGNLVDQGLEVLTDGGAIARFGELLDAAWRAKQRLSSKVTSSRINAIYQRARTAGAIGGKLVGAGAAGFSCCSCLPPAVRGSCTHSPSCIPSASTSTTKAADSSTTRDGERARRHPGLRPQGTGRPQSVSYTCAVQGALRERGLAVEVLVNRGCPPELADAHAFRRIFTSGGVRSSVGPRAPARPRLPALPEPGVRGGAGSRDPLRSGVPRHLPVLPHARRLRDRRTACCHPRRRSWRGWLCSTRQTPRYSTCGWLQRHLNPYWWLRPRSFVATRHRLGPRFQLCTDSALLSRDYARVYDGSILTLPIPPTSDVRRRAARAAQHLPGAIPPRMCRDRPSATWVTRGHQRGFPCCHEPYAASRTPVWPRASSSSAPSPQAEPTPRRRRRSTSCGLFRPTPDRLYAHTRASRRRGLRRPARRARCGAAAVRTLELSRSDLGRLHRGPRKGDTGRRAHRHLDGARARGFQGRHRVLEGGARGVPCSPAALARLPRPAQGRRPRPQGRLASHSQPRGPGRATAHRHLRSSTTAGGPETMSGPFTPSRSFWEGKRLLVTGASGFVGKNLVPLLEQANCELLLPARRDHDLTEQASVRRLLTRQGPTSSYTSPGWSAASWRTIASPRISTTRTSSWAP